MLDTMKLKGSDDNVNVEMKSSSYPDERFFGAYLYVVLPSPMQIDDTITLEIDGREIDIEVETVPDVYENYLRKQYLMESVFRKGGYLKMNILRINCIIEVRE